MTTKQDKGLFRFSPPDLGACEHHNKLVDWLRHAEFFAGELARS
ncbi:MAG: hypothetical protein ACI4WT_03330 [Oligosphaeraceae bacterium]